MTNAALIAAMRSAFARGENAMEIARSMTSSPADLSLAVEIAYDLQAGSYVNAARREPVRINRWSTQLVDEISRCLRDEPVSLLEVGVGEATTLAGVVDLLGERVRWAGGFDTSWSRISVARQWLHDRSVRAETFVADLFGIPLADSSVDVVYSSHSLEPNGGRETEAIRECLRVARGALVLVEPAYEFASPEAQARMRQHGYVRGLREAATALGARIIRHEALPFSVNPLNPSGVLVLQKQAALPPAGAPPDWQCPLTGGPLRSMGDAFFNDDAGIAYPVMRDIPLLAARHAVIASRLDR